MSDDELEFVSKFDRVVSDTIAALISSYNLSEEQVKEKLENFQNFTTKLFIDKIAEIKSLSETDRMIKLSKLDSAIMGTLMGKLVQTSKNLCPQQNHHTIRRRRDLLPLKSLTASFNDKPSEQKEHLQQ